jgi:biotin carboxylase
MAQHKISGNSLMTQNDVIRMATEAKCIGRLAKDKLMHFAALVAAAERETCLRAVHETIAVAVALEREKCAQVCDNNNWFDMMSQSPTPVAKICADEIRGRNRHA